MAISANAVWEFRSTATANNANGGFFVTGATGTDWSQQNGAQYNLTNVTSAGAGNVILSTSAAADMVGNGLHATSGTNFTVGWYEILSVVAGVSITLSTNVSGTSITTGAGASGVCNIGGAQNFGALDDNVMEAGTAGNTIWVKAGTYTAGGAISIALAGTSTAPIMFKGYNVTRGDAPLGTSRPVLNMGTNGFTYGAQWQGMNIIINSSAAGGVNAGAGGFYKDVKHTNNSTTANRAAFTTGVARAVNMECISYRGIAINSANNTMLMDSCYMHDSDIGYKTTATSATNILVNCVIESNVTAAIQTTGAMTGALIIDNCTLFGGITNKTGTGVLMATGITNPIIKNTILAGFATAVNSTDNLVNGADIFNDYFGNTADVTNWTKGPGAQALDPTWTLVGQLTGSTASILGSVINQVGADFSTVTDNVDFIYIISGTGVTVGQYMITSHTTTTVTVDIAPGSSGVTDKVWQITTGRNFGIGTNLKALGTPGVIGASTGYTDIGAIQRQEPKGENAYVFITG